MQGKEKKLKTIHPKETFCTDHLLKLFLPHWEMTCSDTSSFRNNFDLKDVHFVQSSSCLIQEILAQNMTQPESMSLKLRDAMG